MRPEKKFLVEEARARIGASNHVFFVNFTGVKVSDVAELRKALAEVGAEYHVAKNSIISIVSKELNMPDISEVFSGPTGIISGGSDEASVAKAVVNFFKTRENASIKLGVLGEKLMTKEEVEVLGSLPSMAEMRAKFLSLLSTPARQMVRVLFVRGEKLGEGSPAAEASAEPAPQA